jgi:hypothetical protein
LRFSAWTSLIGALLGAGTLALSSVMPRRQLWNPARAAAIALVSGAVLYAVGAILAGVFEERLPLGIAPATKLPPAGIPHPIGAHALLAAQLACAILFAVAAFGFTRRAESTGDELFKWFAASAVWRRLRVSYALSSLYTEWVYVGDALRFALTCFCSEGRFARSRATNEAWPKSPRSTSVGGSPESSTTESHRSWPLSPPRRGCS